MSDYDWGSKTKLQKVVSYLLTVIFLIGFGYFALAISTHHLITLADFGWHFFWAILKCLIIIALFPAIIFPVVFSFQSDQTHSPPKHEFFTRSATVHTGYGRSGGTSFSVGDVESIHLERVVYRGRTIFLVTVQFKPWNFSLLGRRGNERFGVQMKSEAELQPLRDCRLLGNPYSLYCALKYNIMPWLQ